MEKLNNEFAEYYKECQLSLFVCGQSLIQYANSPEMLSYFSLGDKYNEFNPVVPKETFEERFARRAKQIQEARENIR